MLRKRLFKLLKKKEFKLRGFNQNFLLFWTVDKYLHHNQNRVRDNRAAIGEWRAFGDRVLSHFLSLSFTYTFFL